jgi:undecaprenyl-diphosphatase
MSDLSYLEAVVIGGIQGFTELFPVSSLGHSVLVPAWFGGSWEHLVTEQSTSVSEKSPYLAFIVATHCATALALLVFYWRAWVRIIGGVLTSLRTRSITTPTQRLGWLIVAATIPTGIIGLALEHPLRVLFAKPLYAAIFLTINGLILFAGELIRRRRPEPDFVEAEEDQPSAKEGSDTVAVEEGLLTTKVGIRDAIMVGMAQTLALLAGISRSGVTMVAGLIRGLDHESAANFSFLLATPIIFAAGVLKLPTLANPAAAGIRGPTLAGAVVAFFAALVAVRFLTRYFERRSLYPFAAYCLVAGIASIVHFA